MKKINISFNNSSMVILLMLIGILSRGILLGTVPGGINQDEAFAGYEAYSILNYGTDSEGYSFPVYLSAWGSGMNALNTYLMIPFISVWGLHTWVIRIPQFLISCISLYFLYRLLRKCLNEKAALWGLFYFSVCPWSILMARWGLESNLAPGFLLFGLYFFVVGTENSKYYILSALFYGLSLYCYATIWVIVPIILVLQISYVIWTKKLRIDRYFLLSTVFLCLLALPLILFLLINRGYLSEINTALISIPRLNSQRSGEVSFRNIRYKATNMLRILLTQSDTLYWNATPEFGMYYKWFLPFFVIGFVSCAYHTLISLVKRIYDPLCLLLPQFMCSLLLGCLVYVNINRINCIHIPIISFTAIGIYQTVCFLKKRFQYIDLTAFIAIGISFILFEHFYFTGYAGEIKEIFCSGMEDALNYAESINSSQSLIYVDTRLSYARVLFFRKIPADTYRSTRIQQITSDNTLWVTSFDHYRFENPDPAQNNIYIIKEDMIPVFRENDWQIEQFEHTAVAYKQP